MKLFNRTRIPDEPLKALLVKAGKSVGARTLKVIVQVNRARYRIKGVAYECDWWRVAPSKRRIGTDGGAFKMGIPLAKPDRPDTFYSGLSIAERVYKLAQHEWGHIRDYQHGGKWSLEWSRRGAGGRRPAWEDRPEEQRACAYRDDAEAIDKGIDWAQDEILALGIALEEAAARMAEERTA